MKWSIRLTVTFLMMACLIPAPRASGIQDDPIIARILTAGIRDGNGDVYLYEVTATTVSEIRLTTEEGFDGFAMWSPDGSQIAFSSARTGDDNIYLMDDTGSILAQLTDHPLPEYNPVWSPDGTQFVYVSEQNGNRDLYLMDADGSNQRRLTDDFADDWQPVWSPDGTQIIFASYRDNGSYASLYRINADGTDLELIQRYGEGEFRELAWSPNGSTILTSYGYSPNYDIYRLNPDGSDFQLVVHHPDGASRYPMWSPDGSQFAFVLMPHDTFGDHIYIADADGSNLRPITDPNQPYTLYDGLSWWSGADAVSLTPTPTATKSH